MVLDIGGSVGALHVLVDDGWVGRELFLATDDPGFSVHTGVWLRHLAGEHVASALFAALEEGTYRVLGDDGATVATVRVAGGEVAEIDLTARGRRCSGRHGAMTVAGGDSSPPRTWQWVEPVVPPQQAGPRAQHGVEEVLAVLGRPVDERRRLVEQRRRHRVAAQVDRRVVERGDPPHDLVGVARPAAPGTRPGRAAAACACRSGARRS